MTLCCFSFISFAQPDNEQRYDSKINQKLKIEDKEEHILFIGCKEGECDVYWNDQKITSEYTFDAAVDFFMPIKNDEFPNVFLLPIYNGDGCPVKYKILQIPDKKRYYLSESFGNCDEVNHSIKKKIMTLQFEGTEAPINRPTLTYTYHLKKGVLEKVE